MSAPARLRVLIGDDHPGVVRAVTRLLGLTYDVVGSVADGAELLEAARRLRPDVIVLDVHLRQVDGFEACRLVREAQPEVRVILFSAADDAIARRRAAEAGAEAFVSKLAVVESLLPALARIDGERGD